ncbi:MAG: HAMP domain-containing sensor histidine kinase [Thermoplasmata archaeon]
MLEASSRTRRKPVVKRYATPPRFAGEMLSVLTDVMSVESLDTVLQKIAETIAELFSMRTLVIGVLEEHERVFRVRAAYGYDPERERKIKKFTYTYERLQKDMDEKYKVAEDVYFIRPSPAEFIKGEEPFYQNLANITKPRTDPSVWHELDYFRFIFRDRTGRPIGFLELNDSMNDRIPDMATIEAMQIFSKLAGVAIENARLFQQQVEAAKRSMFLSDIIAHDINNYNQAVTSYLQLATASKGVPAKVANYLERASAAAWSISETIQRANKLVTIEQEGAKNLGPVELGQVLKESVEEVRRTHEDRDFEIDLKLGNHRYFVMGNELANEIFVNIISNAIDYDPHEKAKVEISIGEFTVEPRKYWCVSVADNGIGIPDSKKNVVFGRFSGGEDTGPGSGLGLSIVRAVVEAYHGMVWVEDRVPGDPSKGSVFRVALPMTSGK